ncbi:hypothetical protein BGW80DRAFT_1447960 [Lactifluus volemus]|nr:hypothetical protein BGW80DRAFT_1447960 [Lactifluus volemus]
MGTNGRLRADELQKSLRKVIDVRRGKEDRVELEYKSENQGVPKDLRTPNKSLDECKAISPNKKAIRNEARSRYEGDNGSHRCDTEPQTARLYPIDDTHLALVKDRNREDNPEIKARKGCRKIHRFWNPADKEDIVTNRLSPLTLDLELGILELVLEEDIDIAAREGYGGRARKVNSIKRGEVAVKKTMEKLHTVLLFLSTHRECSHNRSVVVRQRKTSLIQQELGLSVSQRLTIGSLPDNVLLDMFKFYRVINKFQDEYAWDWETLVHVCQRWRYLVFESPIRLDLQLSCTEKTPVRKLLDVWPASLPITIHFCPRNYLEIFNPVCFDNIVAALKHCDRVHQIHIVITEDYQWEDVVTAMQGPFPKLRSLALRSFRGGLIIPDTFLNGSAPCLQVLNLNAISFPSLPRLLLSTTSRKPPAANWS